MIRLQIGEHLYQARARYLVDTQQGLTTCYNRLKDPQEDDDRRPTIGDEASQSK